MSRLDEIRIRANRAADVLIEDPEMFGRKYAPVRRPVSLLWPADALDMLAVVEAAVAWREVVLSPWKGPETQFVIDDAEGELIDAIEELMAAGDAATDEPRVGKSHTSEML
jgi:hypothetical protein